MFVTFEGLDFSGKTTQACRLVDRLVQYHLEQRTDWPPVMFIREPGGTAISERIRDILLDRRHLEMADLTELFLFSASRAQLVMQMIRPALSRGEIVVCDRYHDSTTAYQGYGRGLDLADVRYVNAVATSRLDPDLTILVDIAVDEIEQRKGASGVPFDRMESAGRAFYERVREGYLALAAEQPGRYVRVNGMGTVEAVEAEVWGAFKRRFSVKQQTV